MYLEIITTLGAITWGCCTSKKENKMQLKLTKTQKKLLEEVRVIIHKTKDEKIPCKKDAIVHALQYYKDSMYQENGAEVEPDKHINEKINPWGPGQNNF